MQEYCMMIAPSLGTPDCGRLFGARHQMRAAWNYGRWPRRAKMMEIGPGPGVGYLSMPNMGRAREIYMCASQALCDNLFGNS